MYFLMITETQSAAVLRTQLTKKLLTLHLPEEVMTAVTKFLDTANVFALSNLASNMPKLIQNIKTLS